MESPRTPASSAGAVIDRLLQATNARDLEALVGCFAPHYVNETPAHPARGFTGSDQVRRNWAQIFAAVPDLVARITGWAENDGAVWTEWEMSGSRRDGSPHHIRGVIIFRVTDDRITAARFYLEPVDTSTDNVDAAVAAQLAGRP